MVPRCGAAGYLPLAVAGIVFPTLLPAQTPSGITLAASPNPSVYGRPVTLTATVTSGATGKVTFYDSVTILGVVALSGAKASLTTVMLPAGNRKLRAYYQGDTTNAASTSAVVPQTVAALSSPALHRPIDYSFGGGAPIVADVNGDGKMDLVFVLPLGVAVYLGNGDGTFQTIPLGGVVQNEPQSVVVADFNGDGLADVATSNALGSVAVLLQASDGSLNWPLYSWGGNSPAGAAVADFNGDGIADLAISQKDSPDVAILLGKGDGTFQNPVFVPAGNATLPPVVADVNGDGNADLIVSSKGGVEVILGNGNGTFQASKTLTLTGAPLAAADLNGDGNVDLISIDASDISDNRINVALGNGDGTFGPPLPYSIPPDAGTPMLADVNGDGKLDLVIPGYFYALSYQHLAVAFGNGDGTFGPPTLYPLPDGPFAPGSAVAGDFNRDGRTDLAIPGATGGFEILFGGLTCAITGDALPANADVQLILTEALGTAPPNDDINQDGTINVVDIQTVVNATFGLGCIY
jgi:hypothetical protein